MALSNMKKRAQRTSGGRSPAMNLAVKVEEFVASGKDYNPADHVVGIVMHNAESFGLKAGDPVKVSLRPYDNGYRRGIHQLNRKDGNERKVHPGGIVVFENVRKDFNNPDVLNAGWVKALVHQPFDPKNPDMTEMVYAGLKGTVYQADMTRGRQQVAITAPHLAKEISNIAELEAQAMQFLANDKAKGVPGFVLRATVADGDPAASGADRNRYAATFSLWRKQDDEGEWRNETAEEGIERLRDVAEQGRGNIGTLLQDLQQYDADSDQKVVWTVEPLTMINVGPKSLPYEKNGRKFDLAEDFTFGSERNQFSLWTDCIIGLKKGEESGAWFAAAAWPITNKFDAKFYSLSNLATPHTPENHAEYLATEGFTTRNSGRQKQNENDAETDPEAEATANAPGM